MEVELSGSRRGNNSLLVTIHALLTDISRLNMAFSHFMYLMTPSFAIGNRETSSMIDGYVRIDRCVRVWVARGKLSITATFEYGAICDSNFSVSL